MKKMLFQHLLLSSLFMSAGSSYALDVESDATPTATENSEQAKNPAETSHKKYRLFPHGCRQIGFEFSQGHLVLKTIPEGLSQTLYLLHNKASYAILLKNDVQSKFIPTYEKTIPHNHWTAFARDVDTIGFVCNTPTGQFLDCASVLELCNYNNAKFPYTNVGTYWITNTGTQREAMRGSISKGILLRW